MTPQRRDVLVIGGGISGLTAAWRLKKSGVDVALLEAAPTVGGCTQTVRKNGFILEQGPFNVIVRDPAFEQLLDDVSDSIKVISAAEQSKARFIYHHEQLQLVPTNPIKLLTTKLLSKSARARLIRGLFWSARSGPTEETFEQVVTRRLGAEVADTIVSAAINGILAGDISKLTLAACYPKIAEADSVTRSPIGFAIRKAFGKKKKGPRHKRKWRGLVSIEGGLGSFMDALGAGLGEDCLTNCRVKTIRADSGGYEIEFEDTSEGAVHPRTITCRRLVIALPVAQASSVLAEQVPEAASAIAPITSASLAVLNLGYRSEDVGHGLRGFGFLVPRTESEFPIMGVLWSDSIFPHYVPDGHRLLRVFIGGAQQPDALNQTDGELLRRATQALGHLLNISGEPILVDTIRYQAAIPQYHAGHRERIARFRNAVAQHKGLHVVGNYLDGASLNDCVRVANACAMEIVETADGAGRHAIDATLVAC